MIKNSDLGYCGIAGCHPAFLKPLANIKSFIVFFGLLGFLSWSLYTFTLSQISTMEKAFGLSSAETGWLLMIWEVGYTVCTIGVSYYSSRAHIPRVIGIATIVCGLSGIVTALPHFIAFDAEPHLMAAEQNGTVNTNSGTSSSEYLCVPNATYSVSTSTPANAISSFTSAASKRTIAYALFNVGMIMQGMGKAPCYPYSSHYIDDNGDKRKTGFYVGIASSIAIFGLTGGYGIGSLVSQMHVTLKETSLSLTDPRFIGAWWLGFVSIGFATLLIAVPMFCYPRRLKLDAVQKDKTTKQEQGRPSGGLQVAVKEAKIWLSACLHVFKTPIYVISVLASCIQILGVSSFLGFEPKYMETQFAVPSWLANIILGVASIGSFAIGSLISGFISKRYNMNPTNTFRFIIGMNLTSLLFTILALFLGCPHQTVINPLDTNHPLVSDCDCSGTQFLPICGVEDQQTYFSPCHAGCTNSTMESYHNCTSIPGGSASLGQCSTGCNMLWPFSVAKFFMNVCEAMVGIPFFLVFLRSVGEEHKGIALGMSSVTITCLAWLPGPVLGGNIVDSTCLVWSTAPTSGQFCAFYNIEQLRYRLHGLQIGFRGVAIIVLILLLVFKARKVHEWPTNDPKQDGDSVIEADEDADNEADTEEMVNTVI